MDYEFSPRHLLSPEIEYELKIRNVNSRKDRSEKIKILARLLHREAQGSDIIDLENYESSFDDERDAINSTIVNITSLILDFEGNPADSLFNRIKSRLAHVTGRVQRLDVPDEGDNRDEIKNFKEETYATCLELDAEVHDKIITDTLTTDPNQSATGRLSTVNIPPPVVTCSKKQILLSDLNVKFNGDPNLVYNFIERITEIAHARGVTDEDLFKSAVELFVGDAFVWYRSVKNIVLNWPDLLLRLKTDFLSPCIEDEIWDQIKSRKQRKDESVILFIAQIENLFTRLSRTPCEATKVKILKQNLLPEYISQLALSVIDSVQDLVNLVKRLEEANYLKNKNRNLSNRQTMQTCEIYRNNNHNNNANFNNEQRTNTPNFSSRVFERNVSAQHPTASNYAMKCWNCNKIGHLYSSCRLKKNKFCFRCGAANVTVKTCSRCKKN